MGIKEATSSTLEKLENSTELDDLIFGAISGIAGKMVEFPFDTVKVRLQTSSPETFKGPFDCFKKTYLNEGILGFYKGFSSPIFGSMLENAILFSGYNHSQNLIRKITNKSEDEPLSVSQYTLCGGLAGVGAAMLLTPVELIKCKLQVQDVETLYHAKKGLELNVTNKIHYKGPLHVLGQTLKNHGLRGMYRGHMGTLIREVCGGAAWFGIYELACNNMMKRSNVTNKNDLEPWKLAVCGALAGISYNSTSFPVDLIKSRMQTEDFVIGATKKIGKGFISTASEIYRTGGIKAFYKGCGITVARSAPSSGIIFVTYELLKRNFGKST